MMAINMMMQLERYPESAFRGASVIGAVRRDLKPAYTRNWLHRFWGFLTQQSFRFLLRHQNN